MMNDEQERPPQRDLLTEISGVCVCVCDFFILNKFVRKKLGDHLNISHMNQTASGSKISYN